MNLARTGRWTAIALPSLVAITLGLAAGRSTPMSAQDDTPWGAMPPEIMARITPGPQHSAMAWYLGDWTVALRMTMPGMPQMPPEQATCRYEWLIEGRWMMSRMKGTMMGAPVEWVHVLGYNNMTMNYETIGFDSMSTDSKFSFGNPVTKEGKTFGFQGVMNEFLTGQINKPFRTVLQQRGDDRFDLQIWDPEIGPNGAQVMLMEFTRAKK